MSGGTYIGPGMPAMVGPDTEIVALAQKALTKPSGFGYWGNRGPNEGWGWTGLSAAKNEDDPINRSNLSVIHEELAAQWPDDVAIERSQHWAIGPFDELRVKVLVDPDIAIVEGNITEAFFAVVDWARKLDGYPVADDDNYSDLEREEAEAIGWIYCEEHGEYRDPSDCRRDGHTHEEVS